MAVTAGIEIEPAAAPVASGMQSGIGPRSTATDGDDPASFQSSLQSMVGSPVDSSANSSGADSDGDAPQAPSAGAGNRGASGAQQAAVPNNGTQSAAGKSDASQSNVGQSSNSQTNAQQNATARYRLGTGIAGYQDLLASLQPDAAHGAASSANATGWSKTARHPGGTEKKPAAAGASMAASTTPALAVMTAIAAPVLQNLPPQPARAAAAPAAHPAQSFLTSSQPAATGHGGILPAPAATAAAGANGVAESGDQAVAAAGTHTHLAHAAAQAGSAQPATAAAGAGSTPGANRADINPADTNPAGTNADASNSADSHGNALKDASGNASAAAVSTSAAHTVAASDTSSARRVAESATPRAAQGSPGHGSADSVAGSLPAPPAGLDGEASAAGRDAAGGHGAMNGGMNGGTNTVAVNAPASSSSTPDSHETFAALDSDAARGASWLHAGAHSAEAGFQDPSLGWVSVRADLAAGSVHASVVAGTADAAQALSGHMAGLNSYLNDHRTPVQTLTLASPGGDGGFNQMAGQGGGQESGGYSGAGQQASSQAAVVSAAHLSQPVGPAAFAGSDAAPAAMRMGASISLIA
jgi:hypothetical protein